MWSNYIDSIYVYIWFCTLAEALTPKPNVYPDENAGEDSKCPGKSKDL